MLNGAKIYLRPFEVKDITSDYINWLNDEEVNRYLESRFTVQTKESVTAYVKSFENNKNKMLFGIFDSQNHLHIGNISFSEINWSHLYGVIGLAIGRKEYWGKGFGREALQLIVDYGFNELKLHRLEAGAYSDNKNSIRIFEKLGFKIDGIQKEKYLLEKKRKDGVLLSKIKTQGN